MPVFNATRAEDCLQLTAIAIAQLHGAQHEVGDQRLMNTIGWISRAQRRDVAHCLNNKSKKF